MRGQGSLSPYFFERADMDLRGYYQKIRQLEASLTEEHVVTVSKETPEGGKEGVLAEVPRLTAARHVVEGKARLATADEAKEFREKTAAAKEEADRKLAASRVQIPLVTEAELRALRGSRGK